MSGCKHKKKILLNWWKDIFRKVQRTPSENKKEGPEDSFGGQGTRKLQATSYKCNIGLWFRGGGWNADGADDYD
jgi:hypothetical protein